jgi:hypothetical protein
MRKLGWALFGLWTAMAAPACGSGDSMGIRNGSLGGAGGAVADDGDQGGAEAGPGGVSNEFGGAAALDTGGVNGNAGDAEAGSSGEREGPAGGVEQAPAGGSAGALADAGRSGTAGAAARRVCHSNGDCAEGQACAEYGRDERFHCRETSSSGSRLGQSCTSGQQCRDQICLGFSEQCTRLCEDDRDCGDDDGFLCLELGGEGFCQKPCRSDWGCEEHQHCSIVLRREPEEYVWVCAIGIGERSIGEKPAGGDCTTESGCASGLCLAYGPEDHPSHVCTGACQSEDDCPGDSPVPACGSVTMMLADGTTQAVSACTPG